MKLRIRGNSLRLRLLQSEVAKLETSGKVSEEISFGTSKLTYALQISDQSQNLSADFIKNEIVVSVPEKIVRDWAESNKVGLETIQKISENEDLKILVEKDFACSSRPNDADNADAYLPPE